MKMCACQCYGLIEFNMKIYIYEDITSLKLQVVWDLIQIFLTLDIITQTLIKGLFNVLFSCCLSYKLNYIAILYSCIFLGLILLSSSVNYHQ